jgi:cytochrome c biogenesis protein
LRTRGIRWRASSVLLNQVIELLSSMRLAVMLLAALGVASIAGTVLQQDQPWARYVDRFGPFWAQVWAQTGLTHLYSTPWFVGLVAVLLISTTLCVGRHLPFLWRDWRHFKQTLTAKHVRAMRHRANWESPHALETTASLLQTQLRQQGWRVRQSQKAEGLLLACQKGGLGKLGYVASHTAIVLIGLGGLLDSNLGLTLRMAWQDKPLYEGAGLIAQVPPSHRFAAVTNDLRSPAAWGGFRGSLWIPEKQSAHSAVITQSQGVWIADLPFSVELERFVIDYYDNGMPKLFASDIVLKEWQPGVSSPVMTRERVSVNHPVTYHGVQLYQSSFDDGGSLLHLSAHRLLKAPLKSGESGQPGQGMALQAQVGSSQILPGGKGYTVEFTGLRTTNVEPVEPASLSMSSSIPHGEWQAQWTSTWQSIQTVQGQKQLRNVGPSMTYKLRDQAGQAIEYQTYLLPIVPNPQVVQASANRWDTQPVYLFGMRRQSNEDFTYWRIPADEKSSTQTFFQLYQALQNPGWRRQAAERFAQTATVPGRQDLARSLTQSAHQALTVFAGGGLSALSQFIERHVAPAEQADAARLLMELLTGTLGSLWDVANEQAGLAPWPRDEAHRLFLQQTVMSLSDGFFYPAPVLLQLTHFEPVLASVLQVSYLPGQMAVYLGCALLVLGVFGMLYVREKRLWIWLEPAGDSLSPRSTRVDLGLVSQRGAFHDTQTQFEALNQRLSLAVLAAHSLEIPS